MDQAKEKLNQVMDEFDTIAQGFPELVKVGKRVNVPPKCILAGAAVAGILGLIIFQGYAIVCAVLTCVYPMI